VITTVPDVDYDELTDAEFRRLESQARRMAARYGLRVQKCRTRNPERYDFGTYQVLDATTNFVVAYGSRNGYGLNLAEVFQVLTEDN
jgi:hypothetical protein